MPLFKSNIDDPHKANRDDGDEFAFDHVMGRFNRHETFRADHDPDLHKKPPHQATRETNANLVLQNIDERRLWEEHVR
ncbi:MAG: hypothetical protein OSB82_15195 [Alphaproteobacteria bacterium]|nr:hypothetical protein [Alphaproteobacteria bacterium]